VTETTNMMEATISNEMEVETKLYKIASQVDDIILAEFVRSDIASPTRFKR